MRDEEREIENWIADDEARDSDAVKGAVCTICKESWVDVLAGEDTCPDCVAS